MNEPRQCERCGETLDNGQERGPLGDFLFLSDRCERKLQEQPANNPAPRPRPPQTYRYNPHLI